MVEVVIINSSDVYSQILADLESTAKEAQMSNLAFNEWCSQSISLIMNHIDAPLEKVEVFCNALKTSFDIISQNQPQEEENSQDVEQKLKEAHCSNLQNMQRFISVFLNKKIQTEATIEQINSRIEQSEVEYKKTKDQIKSMQNQFEAVNLGRDTPLELIDAMNKFMAKEVSINQVYLDSIATHKQQLFDQLQESAINIEKGIDIFQKEKREIIIFTQQEIAEGDKFRWEGLNKLTQFKTYKSYAGIDSFAVTEQRRQTRLGSWSNDEFSTVQMIEDVHTIRIRHDNTNVNEIEFVSPIGKCTTNSAKAGGVWEEFKMMEKESIVGIYGSMDKNHNYFFKTLGFIISTLN